MFPKVLLPKVGTSKTYKIANLNELKVWIESHKNLFSYPIIFLLIGEMAAGKTTLVSEVVKGLDPESIENTVSSPTFSLHHRYLTPKLAVDHMDLYRLESDEDLESSGFFELLEEDRNLFFVEWADRLPKDIFFKNRAVLELSLSKSDLSSESRVLALKRIF